MLHKAGNSLAAQRMAISLGVQRCDGKMDCGIEGFGIGEGLVWEIASRQ